MLVTFKNEIYQCVQCANSSIRLNIRALVSRTRRQRPDRLKWPASTSGITFFAEPYGKLFNSRNQVMLLPTLLMQYPKSFPQGWGSCSLPRTPHLDSFRRVERLRELREVEEGPVGEKKETISCKAKCLLAINTICVKQKKKGRHLTQYTLACFLSRCSFNFNFTRVRQALQRHHWSNCTRPPPV